MLGENQTVIYDPAHKRAEDKIFEWLDNKKCHYSVIVFVRKNDCGFVFIKR